MIFKIYLDLNIPKTLSKNPKHKKNDTFFLTEYNYGTSRLDYEACVYKYLSESPILSRNIVHFVAAEATTDKIVTDCCLVALKPDTTNGFNIFRWWHKYLTVIKTIITVHETDAISLRKYLGHTSHTKRSLVAILFQILWGIQQLQKLGVQHNDLHAENILISKTWPCPDRSYRALVGEGREGGGWGGGGEGRGGRGGREGTGGGGGREGTGAGGGREGTGGGGEGRGGDAAANFSEDLVQQNFILDMDAPRVIFFDWDMSDRPKPNQNDVFLKDKDYFCGEMGICGMNERADVYKGVYGLLGEDFQKPHSIQIFLESIISGTIHETVAGLPCNRDPNDITKCISYNLNQPKNIKNTSQLLGHNLFIPLRD
jgi:hypothetical protein